MTIYIDTIFFENIIMNVIILYATAIVLKIKPKLIKIVLSSAIGSIYAIILYVTKLSIYTSIISKIILSVIMIYIGFNPQGVKKLCKQVVIFYLISFIFGGVALYLIYTIKPQSIFIKNGIYIGNYVFKVIFLGAILAFGIIKISIKIIKTKINTKDMYCRIKIKINNMKIETIAMLDTGNLAKEPITNTPVIIVERSLLDNVISKEILDNVDKILEGDLSQISEKIKNEYITKLRCIPFSSLGKQNGMMLGIKADELEVEVDEEKKVSQNIIIGIYDKELSKKGEYRALIGLDLI